MDKIVCEFSENVFGKEGNLHVIPNFDNQSPAAGQVRGRKMWVDVRNSILLFKKFTEIIPYTSAHFSTICLLQQTFFLDYQETEQLILALPHLVLKDRMKQKKSKVLL